MIRCSSLGSENLVRRLAGQLEDKIDLSLHCLPGGAVGEGHRCFFQGLLLSSESLVKRRLNIFDNLFLEIFG